MNQDDDPTATDAEAIRQCRTGDITGLDVLARRYQLAAVRLAFLLVQDQSAAEDIVQDSFLLAFRASHRFRDGSPFAPWFHRIVLNSSRQYLRTLGRRKETSLAVLEPEEATGKEMPLALDPYERMERIERRDAVISVLRILTPKQREALVMRYYGGYADAEIAAILDCPRGTVRWRLHTALQAFKRGVHQMYPWLLDQGDLPGVLTEVTGGISR